MKGAQHLIEAGRGLDLLVQARSPGHLGYHAGQGTLLWVEVTAPDSGLAQNTL